MKIPRKKKKPEQPIIVSKNHREAYIISELNSSVFDRPIAVFQLVPYFSRQQLSVLANIFDVPSKKLEEIRNKDSQGNNDPP